MDKYTKSQIKYLKSQFDIPSTADDKILQYKGLLAVFGRERRNALNAADRIRRIQVKTLKELRKDCQYFRAYLINGLYGSKQRMRNALQDSTIQLAYQNLWPSRVIEYFEHANHCQQRTLDLIKFSKRKRNQILKNLSVEKSQIEKKRKLEILDVRFRRQMQILHCKIQRVVARQNAAADINKLYQNMLDILQRDKQYFDAILKIIHEECAEHCQCVLQAAEVGQLASEALLDLQEEYTWIENEVRTNMKEREKQVRRIKRNVDELKTQCKSATIAQSYAEILKHPPSSVTLMSLELQPRSRPEVSEEYTLLEDILQEMRDATLASTYEDVFQRILFQMQQEQALLTHVQKLSALRKTMLTMKNHSELFLMQLKQAAAVAEKNDEEAREILQKEQVEEQYRIGVEKETTEENSEILAHIKAALRSLFEMISIMKEKTAGVVETSSSESLVSASRQMSASDVQFLPPIERDSRRLLEEVAGQLQHLLGRTRKVALEDERLANARASRYRQMLNKRVKTAPHTEHNEDLVETVEREDVTIMSRADIKVKSKQLVERAERYEELRKQGLLR